MVRKNVPVKTKEGTQEIRARSLGLAPRIRTALLLVDGVKSVSEFESLMAAAGVTPGALQMLLDKGLIRFAEEDGNTMAAVTAYHAAPTILDVDPQPAPGPVEEAEHGNASYFAPTLLEIPPQKATPQKDIFPPIEPMPAATAVEAKSTAQAAPSAPAVPVVQVVPKPVPPRMLSAPLEVVTLLELETILGEATKMEVATLLGVATMLELTPTQLMLPRAAAKAPPEAPRLPSQPQVERQRQVVLEAPKLVLPAAVLRMNLMAARAHLAAALDLYLEMDGYLLKQKVMACEAREELEQLFDPIESALARKLNRPTVSSMIATAHVILDR